MTEMRWRFLVILLTAFVPLFSAYGVGQDVQWQSFDQPGSGSISLPGEWTVVVQYEQAQPQKGERGEALWTQRCINAKCVHDGVVCSVKAERVWEEDPGGLVSELSADVPKRRLQDTHDSLAAQGTDVKLVSGPTEQQTDHGPVWRMSVIMNAGSSRIDVVYAVRKGFLHYLSAAYRKEGENYWPSTFDEIVKRWNPGSQRGELGGAQVASVSNEWTSLRTSDGSTLRLPAEWKVIDSNKVVGQEEENGVVCTFEEVVNVRPYRYSGDTSTLQIMSMWANSDSGELPLSAGEADAFGEEIVEGMSQGLPTTKRSSDSRKVNDKEIRLTHYDYGSSEGAGQYQAGLDVAILQGGNRLYCVSAMYPPKDEQYWADTLLEIVRRWDLPPAKSVTPLESTAGLMYVEKEGDEANLRVNWLLVGLSFAVTWAIGLTPPLIIRYAVLRRPIRSKGTAVATAGVLFFIEFIVFALLGTKSQAATMLIAFVTYAILRQGAAAAVTSSPPSASVQSTEE